MSNSKEIKERMGSIQETKKDHQCHVSDLFFQDETGKEKTVRYVTIFL